MTNLEIFVGLVLGIMGSAVLAIAVHVLSFPAFERLDGNP